MLASKDAEYLGPIFGVGGGGVVVVRGGGGGAFLWLLL